MLDLRDRKQLALIAVAAVFVIAGAASILSGSPAGESADLRTALTTGSGSAGFAAPSIAVRDMAYAESDAMIAPMPPGYPSPEPTAGQTAAEVDQRIIRNGSLDLSVDDVSAASAKVAEVADRRGGFVQSSSVSELGDGTHQGYVTVRVPEKEFAASMAEIRGLAKLVKNETAGGQDVTEQYTDLEAQLGNARAQEKQYLEILKSARTVEDILKVQDRLGGIRGTIESLQGRLKYLENATAYSTISVSLSEEPLLRAPTKEFRVFTIVKMAVQSLVEALQGIAAAVIWIVIVGGGLLIPLALLAMIILLIARRLRSKKK